MVYDGLVWYDWYLWIRQVRLGLVLTMGRSEIAWFIFLSAPCFSGLQNWSYTCAAG